MNLGNLKIGLRLHGGFGLVVLFAIIAGAIAIFGMLKLADLTSKIHCHPLAVSNAVRDVRANINAMHRSMKDVALASDTEDINNFARIVDDYERKVFKSFDIIFERFLGDQRDVKEAHQAFFDWKVIRDEVIQLSLSGERDKAVEITKGNGARHVSYMNDEIQVVVYIKPLNLGSINQNSVRRRSNV